MRSADVFVHALSKLDPDTLTPVEALLKLSELKRLVD